MQLWRIIAYEQIFFLFTTGYIFPFQISAGAETYLCRLIHTCIIVNYDDIILYCNIIIGVIIHFVFIYNIPIYCSSNSLREHVSILCVSHTLTVLHVSPLYIFYSSEYNYYKLRVCSTVALLYPPSQRVLLFG